MVIYLHQEGRGIGLANKIAAYALQDEEGLDTVDANRALGLPDDVREYTAVSNILEDLGARSIRLMTNNPRKVATLEKLGVRIDGRIRSIVKANLFNQGYLAAKEGRMKHFLDGSWCYWDHSGQTFDEETMEREGKRERDRAPRGRVRDEGTTRSGWNVVRKRKISPAKTQRRIASPAALTHRGITPPFPSLSLRVVSVGHQEGSQLTVFPVSSHLRLEFVVVVGGDGRLGVGGEGRAPTSRRRMRLLGRGANAPSSPQLNRHRRNAECELTATSVSARVSSHAKNARPRSATRARSALSR